MPHVWSYSESSRGMLPYVGEGSDFSIEVARLLSVAIDEKLSSGHARVPLPATQKHVVCHNQLFQKFELYIYIKLC